MDQPKPTTFSWKEFGQRTWVVVVAGLVFPPLGIFLSWRKPDWTRRAKWIATGVMGLLLIGRLGEQSDTDSKPQATATVANPAPTDSKTSSKGDVGIGDEFTLGSYKYVIRDASTRRDIGKFMFDRFMGEKASPGAKFVIIRYSIENCSSESQTVLADDFILIDSQNRRFKASSKANTALTMYDSDDKDFLLSELQPGVPRTMQQAFEVPEKALEQGLTLAVPKKGVWSSGEVKIKLKVK